MDWVAPAWKLLSGILRPTLRNLLVHHVDNILLFMAMGIWKRETHDFRGHNPGEASPCPEVATEPGSLPTHLAVLPTQ